MTWSSANLTLRLTIFYYLKRTEKYQKGEITSLVNFASSLFSCYVESHALFRPVLSLVALFLHLQPVASRGQQRAWERSLKESTQKRGW